mgnify:CR=1 FL=1
MSTQTEAVSVIIPTYDNVDQLTQCVSSILAYDFIYPVDIIVVNNGSAPIEKMFEGVKKVRVVTTGQNLGWEGGLKEGLKHTTSKYVVFANDDIYVPRSSAHWIRNLVRTMDYHKDFGAIGPSSNVVMGPQNIWSEPYSQGFLAQFLIGFCVMFRREALDDIGGVDDTLPGGDDLDYSIRLRTKGWKLAVQKDIFIYHHGFQTGNKVHGDHTVKNGWNSPQMTERTNTAIIKKHGFLNWWETIAPQPVKIIDESSGQDTEQDAVQKLVTGETVVELGCGGKKTVPSALGVDRVPLGEVIPWVGEISVADVVADVTKKLPFKDASVDTVIARHILEHCVDTISVLREWTRMLKVGGRLIISVPDENITSGIPLNPEHLHAFTPESLSEIGKLLGLKPHAIADHYNYTSFTIAFEKL